LEEYFASVFRVKNKPNKKLPETGDKKAPGFSETLGALRTTRRYNADVVTDVRTPKPTKNLSHLTSFFIKRRDNTGHLYSIGNYLTQYFIVLLNAVL
jgi:hypothetical protein